MQLFRSFIQLFFFSSCLFLLSCNKQQGPKITAIAHAGGGIDGKTYTNSFQALNFNYERGYELFEIDFSWTSDSQLVCLHDWDRTPKWLLDYHGEKPLTLAEFNQLLHPNLSLKPCNLESLNQWLISHPNAYIVTDIKHNNIQGLKLIKHSIENANQRVIPQIYQPEEYQATKDLGYELLIWTLYQFPKENKAVIDAYRQMDLYAITMPQHRAKQGLAKMLNEPYIPSYVHTINNLAEAKNYQKEHGLTSVYTDFLAHDF
ncbi:hypothetical protein OS175_05205 [Marinicella sp. S1101]|uniref:glycerophosphodiester phosphodiesterase family protein n=1 Tax=Marinicella marina TaxID=2996016 RepID=UPI002260AAEA|nr:glycerophosphodiester phosphodiesterase family protein [Marinicella marina]MCX7553266.1 hypothetical protein [Marinicella marina]MDJ1138998.1 hypothetical protein [Marinicella marina]